MTKSDLYSKTRVAALIAAAVLALIALFGITACPNAAGGGGGSSTVNITVKGDANVELPAEPVAVRTGAKWAEAQTTVQGKVGFKMGYVLNSWHLGEDESAPELTDEDAFYTDTTVYVKSRPDLPPLPKPENPGDPTVKITLKVHPAEAGKILGENPISVKKGTTWPQLQNYAKAAFKANYGFSEEHVEWKKEGSVLGSTHSFDSNTIIVAEPEDLRIFVRLTGDSRVTIAEPATITVIDGTKWKDIKTKAADKVKVNDSNYAITAWKLDGESGTVLNDDYEFKKTDGKSRTIYAKTGDRRITLTVKYERLYGPQVGAGTITVFDGDTWGKVKARVAREITIPDHFILSEWHWHGLGSGFISDDYTFKVSKSVPGPAVAFIRPVIKLTISKVSKAIYLTYHAPLSGSDGSAYHFYSINGVLEGTIGNNDQVYNKEHTVTLSYFQMGATEIPQELYELVMGKNPSKFKGSAYPPAEGERQELRPVENVTWFEVILFCNELTRCTQGLGEEECVYTYDGHTYNFRDERDRNVPKMNMSKKGFRLPTSAEWEWAAQGGPKRQVYSGTDSENDLKKHYAWYIDNSGNKTHQVDKQAANDYVLSDMSGNVEEWCWDWYSDSTPASGQTDPTGPAEQVENYGRVVHGGHYADYEYSCRCARIWYRTYSDGYHPEKRGFRIAARLW